MKHLLFIAIVAIAYVISGTGCANIIPPTGGPRDSLPPVLLSANPENFSRNVAGKRITLSFNEYVDVQSIQENLVVSPTPKLPPIVDRKLRTVTIRLRDTLEQNTTYALQFGNAIRDVNEGNVLKGFTYVFTTGNTIDSGSISGRVLIAETGKADSTLIAVLHRSADDSAVAKETPRYYTKLDSSGYFHFRFLAVGTYYLYAMKDEGGTKKYTSKSQLFAFADKQVTTDDSTMLTLYAYQEEPKVTTIIQAPSKSKKEEDRRLVFQTNLPGGQQDLLNDFELIFNDPLKTFDTSKIIFADEKFTPLTGYTITPDSTNRIYTLHYPWRENTKYNLILDSAFASDSADRKLLKTDTLSFITKKESDYGSMRLRFPSLKMERRPVLQLVQGERIVFSQPLTGNEFYTKLFNPGEYEIRILYDANGNGVWDSGQFFGKHLQPEIVQSIAQKLTVRSNWDNEVTIEMEK